MGFWASNEDLRYGGLRSYFFNSESRKKLQKDVKKMKSVEGRDVQQNETPGGSIYWEPHVQGIPIPVEGTYYDIVDEAIDMYMKYAEMGGFEVKKSGQRLTKSGAVKHNYIMCNREGVPKGINVDTLDPEYNDKQKSNTTTHVTGCKARIKLVLDIVSGRYKLEQFYPKHNHMLIPKEYKHFTKKQRKMTQSEKMFVVKAATNKIGATRAHNLLSSMKGGYEYVHGTTDDFKNHHRDVNVFIENTKLVAMFWVDEVSKCNYKEFGDIVSFDATFNSNKSTALMMADAAQNKNNTTIRSILLAKKLTGLNFTNWYRNLRIVLRYEKKMKFVDQPIGPAPDPKTADPDTIDKYYETVNLKQEVACLMLSSMSLDLQRTLEKYNAYDMLKELKIMFEGQAKQELFETVKAFNTCKQEEGQSVSSYILMMKSYLDILKRLGMGKMIVALHAMLKLHEKGILKKAKTPAVLAIREGKIQKDKRKPQGERDSVCHHGKEVGHWRRNSPSYQAELKKRKNASMASTLCLRGSKKFKHRVLSLYMGNGMRAAVEAIGSFDLIIPNGLIIVLDNYHFTPTISRGVV
ncbi:FAR1-related sequence 5-like protein [Tanacetum coccineum]